MIGKVSKIRHGIVGAAIGGTTLLAGTGVIAGGDHPERFDQWQSVVEPAGSNGLRIVDTFDQDFGDEQRRGHETFIAHDFGAPIEIVATSPDAPDDLSVVELVGETRVRIGDPDVTVTGQHRYSLGYTLPNAFLDQGVLSLDVLDPDELEIERFELVVTGMVLDDPVCLVGAADAESTCEIVEIGTGSYRAVVEPLASGSGVTVEGDIVEFVEPLPVDPPDLPGRRDEPNRGLIALGMAGLGAAGAVPVQRWARRKGRNEVFAGGAADAAYGAMPPPRADGTVQPPPPVQLVPDDEMGDLATIEFVPPKGVAPWEAAVLITERVDDASVEGWLSGLAGREVIEFEERDSNLVIRSGPRRSDLEGDDARLLDALLVTDPYVTGKYDAKFAAAWSAIESSQRRRIASSGWWKQMPPGGGFSPKVSGSPFGLIMFGIFALVWSGSALTAFLGAFKSWPLAIGIGIVFPAVVAFFVYRVMLPARSAQGSAIALRAESFRRFLHASEGRHVEWAWTQGILREYSGWAVALGEADAWSAALEKADVPAPARAAAGPIIVHRRAPSIRTTRTAPTQSGGGRSGGSRGGGFRSGRVGGGGGGRSRGSW